MTARHPSIAIKSLAPRRAVQAPHRQPGRGPCSKRQLGLFGQAIIGLGLALNTNGGRPDWPAVYGRFGLRNISRTRGGDPGTLIPRFVTSQAVKRNGGTRLAVFTHDGIRRVLSLMTIVLSFGKARQGDTARILFVRPLRQSKIAPKVLLPQDRLGRFSQTPGSV